MKKKIDGANLMMMNLLYMRYYDGGYAIEKKWEEKK